MYIRFKYPSDDSDFHTVTGKANLKQLIAHHQKKENIQFLYYQIVENRSTLYAFCTSCLAKISYIRNTETGLFNLATFGTNH